MPKQYHWRDERSGVWTHIEESPHQVRIHLRATHRRGTILGVLLLGYLIYVFARSAFQVQGGLGQEVALLVVSCLASSLFQSFFRQKRLEQSFPIAIVEKQAGSEGLRHKRYIFSDTIEAVETRENSGRRSDEPHLCQLYLHLRGEEQALLIHQHYERYQQQLVELAARLADRWGVPHLREG